ncbi:MAG: helix-turn-helix transcriptional regulator [Hyphomicrobiaceae bacterium]
MTRPASDVTRPSVLTPAAFERSAKCRGGAEAPPLPPTISGTSCSASEVALQSIKEVTSRISISRAQIYRLVDAGTFPRPVKICGGRIAWVKSEIDGWINQRVAARDASAPGWRRASGERK